MCANVLCPFRPIACCSINSNMIRLIDTRRLISILKVYFIFILNPPAQVYVQDINLYTMDYLIIIRITAVAVVLYLTRYVCCLYLHLQDVPGPLFAKFTNLQRVWWVKSGRAHEYHRRMHAVYGPAVRFGPNMVSISDPRTIPAIYPSRPGFPKVSDGSTRVIACSHDWISIANIATPRATFIAHRSPTRQTRAPCRRCSIPKTRTFIKGFEAQLLLYIP